MKWFVGMLSLLSFTGCGDGTDHTCRIGIRSVSSVSKALLSYHIDTGSEYPRSIDALKAALYQIDEKFKTDPFDQEMLNSPLFEYIPPSGDKRASETLIITYICTDDDGVQYAKL